ncbi:MULTISPECIES: amidohydrolase [unclassified Paenibacillus]|uniref:amidohydrolase n=1 Tax=unclassified Paenibacillus TaxID=185978 RepID=UPI001AE3502C|nr:MULTISPECIES: amidohydrolase [unclassified Paenibacillus]MBP1155307.1 5-methylthioadenosine/S-adenosylhomocysteine deaminase [Paenibacillus sp. PvP091]MBP1169309.1 5-methylthioadenosine/S-adenosylhomocysteine deaminase [Paenibacillus sp. PvR098]MBP2440337.1 5-methylthioadenosine/S-adenosylhomocysteine deaminase [Paenibacillus sp. PvP052]
MKKTIIENGTFITMDEGNPVIRGFMTMEGNRITYIGEQAPDPEATFDERIDGTGKLFMPGLVNTHGHAAMSLLRGYGDDLALQVWLQEKMWPIEGKFTAHDVRTGTNLSVLEMLKGGTTSFVDMYDHMNEVAEAAVESGMRACLTRGVIGLCSREEQDAKLAEAIQFAKEWHGQAEGRITAMMSPHAPYTCPPDYIERIVQAAHDLNLPIHIHMSETAREVEENVQQYGARPVAHLEKLGVFSRPTLVAHGVHLTDEEIAVLKQYDVRISHNPGSNLKLASGVARVPELLKAGVIVSLGTDGAASNNNLDMLEEIRLAALIHKGVTGDPVAVPAAEALKLGTLYGAKSIWLHDVGALQPGMKADFIALDMDQPHYFPRTNFISHMVYAASSRDVTDVCIDGRWVVRKGECLTLDEEKIKFEAQQCFERLTSG